MTALVEDLFSLKIKISMLSRQSFDVKLILIFLRPKKTQKQVTMAERKAWKFCEAPNQNNFQFCELGFLELIENI